MTNSIKDIGDASCILAIGTNTTSAHPVIGFKVKQAVQQGTKLIVINPREIQLCRFADIWPGVVKISLTLELHWMSLLRTK